MKKRPRRRIIRCLPLGWRRWCTPVLLLAAVTASGCIQSFAEEEEDPYQGQLRNVEIYARELEAKLHGRYNNHPDYVGKVGLVQLTLASEPKVALDGQEIQVELSQIVYDKWGERIPELEKEYYVVTFGHGAPTRMRTRPSVEVGLHNEGGYSAYEETNMGYLRGIKHKPNPGMLDTPAGENLCPHGNLPHECPICGHKKDRATCPHGNREGACPICADEPDADSPYGFDEGEWQFAPSTKERPHHEYDQPPRPDRTPPMKQPETFPAPRADDLPVIPAAPEPMMPSRVPVQLLKPAGPKDRQSPPGRNELHGLPGW